MYSKELRAKHYAIYQVHYRHHKERENINRMVKAKGNTIAWFSVKIPQKTTQGSDRGSGPF